MSIYARVWKTKFQILFQIQCNIDLFIILFCNEFNLALEDLLHMIFTGLENSTRPFVFTSASGCRASGNFHISNEN